MAKMKKMNNCKIENWKHGKAEKIKRGKTQRGVFLCFAFFKNENKLKKT